jgi:hypothetical protein
VILITSWGGVAHGCLSIADENLRAVEEMKIMASDEVPLWATVTHPFASALEFAFGCHHGKLSRVFTIEGHSYKVCCGCGAHFEYSLETMSIMTHHKPFHPLRTLRASRIYRRRKFLRRTARS